MADGLGWVEEDGDEVDEGLALSRECSRELDIREGFLERSVGRARRVSLNGEGNLQPSISTRMDGEMGREEGDSPLRSSTSTESRETGRSRRQSSAAGSGTWRGRCWILRRTPSSVMEDRTQDVILTRVQVERVDVRSTDGDSRVDDLEADQVRVEDERCRVGEDDVQSDTADEIVSVSGRSTTGEGERT